MKSVGEVMAIGPYLAGILVAALRGLEVGATGFDPESEPRRPGSADQIRRELKRCRRWYLVYRRRVPRGPLADGVFNLTNIDRWFPGTD
ncbi:hypothetical protein MJ699_05100 [Klebsiella pneumoniae]|nr:hypothetical protein MJ699_05100 [Klebsiella pneumoniae]